MKSNELFTEENVIKKLKEANVPKDKKALYSLVRWAYLHPNATFQEITSRINMTYLSQRGYMKKYNTPEKRIYNRERSKGLYKASPEVKKQVLFNTRKSRVPYTHYAEDDLLLHDLKKIDASIKKVADEMSVTWTPPAREVKK